MIKLNLYCLLLLLLSYTVTSYAELSESQFSFSDLMSKSDMIVTGKVSSVKDDLEFSKIAFEIDNTIKFAESNDVIEIMVPRANGRKIPDQPDLVRNNRYLLFLNRKSGYWEITNMAAGVIDINNSNNQRDDVAAVYQAHQNSPKLFAKENSAQLKELFSSLSDNRSKTRLLFDLKNVLTNSDHKFIADLLESDNESYQIFGVLQAGRLKLESKRTEIESMLTVNADRVRFHCVVSLGDMGNPKSLPIIVPYLSSADPGLKRASIEALGKIGGDKIVQPLAEMYPTEKDFGCRLSIITAISRLANESEAVSTLEYFQSIETHSLVLRILKRKLAELKSLEEQ